MREDVITVAIPVGTLAALLTALEYLLSTITALCARAAVHGLWLLRLHRSGRRSLDSRHRTRRRFQKDFVTFILGVWLVIGIALVESNLKEGVRVRHEAVESPFCVSVFGKFDPRRVRNQQPPYRVTVEPWVLSVASQLQCRHGIGSVGVGGTTDSFGKKRNMSAPVCLPNPVNVSSGVVKADIGVVELEKGVIKPELRDSEAFILFPLSRTGLGLGEDRVGLDSEGNGVCGDVGISSVFWKLGRGQTTFANAVNISFAIHERICQEYGRTKTDITTIDDDVVMNCTDGAYLDVSCIRKGVNRSAVTSVDIENVAALTVPRGLNGASYACTTATARIEFVFMSAAVAAVVIEDGEPTQPVLLPTRVVIIKGRCERTISGLAHGALLYMADSEWRKDELAKVDRHVRYHAFLMAVSCSQFPLHKLPAPEKPRSGGCKVREVFPVSEIEKDWRVWLLFTGLLVVASVVAIGALMRFLFGRVWRVGSAEWSLAQVAETGDDMTVVVVRGRGDDEVRKTFEGLGNDRRLWVVGDWLNWDELEYHVRRETEGTAVPSTLEIGRH